jgi:hypothetical protein
MSRVHGVGHERIRPMKYVMYIGVAVVLVVLVTLLFTVPVYFLWNWLIPLLFGLPAITFWQAMGLTALCRILFTSPSSSSKS